jgi:hypothetical protein
MVSSEQEQYRVRPVLFNYVENFTFSGFYETIMRSCSTGEELLFFFICIVGGGIKVHSTLRPLKGLLCQPRVIMIMEISVE